MSEVPESRELRDEAFWRSGGDFRWCWPRFDAGKTARVTKCEGGSHCPNHAARVGDHPRALPRRVRFMWNRYPHNIIGFGLQVGYRWFGVRWKASPRPKRRFRP